MLSLQEMSDRLEIQDLLVRYAHAVDTRDWKLFRELFTEDAMVDYSAFGGPRGTVDEVCAFLDSVLPMFAATQHLVANCAIDLDGDRATARTMCHNPMALAAPESQDQSQETAGLLVCGLWYVDSLVRTADGWKLRERSEDKAFGVLLRPAAE
ncbi:nuclear transport factor 2 family protein [Streptacidiphilus sp. EB129]|uniref:nuclear transport factor 2 family protein n=1 Tax=Streptacidiphilus sp. EB129 TaxID=3156262 RepID=UPI003517BDFE